jgi:hypothetical protein
MGRPKSNGPYAPLSATYYRDDAILEVGEQSELLFVRCLAFLADAASDGYITDRQMRVVVGMGMRNVPARVQRLVDVGLLTCVDDAYLVRSWLKWNKTTDEIGKHLKRDRDRKSGVKVVNSARNEDGIQTDSSDQINTEQVNTDHINTDVAEIRADVESLCNHLARLIFQNGSKAPVITAKWLTDARLLIDKDGREFETAMRLISWSQADSFWKSNVLSMPTFRAKYDQLRLAANRSIEERRAKPSKGDRARAVIAQGEARDAARLRQEIAS